MTERTNKYRNPPPRRVIGPKGGGQPPPQQQQQQQMQMAPIPKTILIECNRYNSVEKDDTNFTLWKSEFTGGINIKKGDELRIHSAYLSSRGVADLIAFIQDENNVNYDSEANWIMEYYVTNDGKNGKRNGYNLNGGPGTWFYDLDMRPLRLERMIPDRTVAPSPPRANAVADISYYQDPYCPARILGADFNVKSFQLPVDVDTVYQCDLCRINGDFFQLNEFPYTNPGTMGSPNANYTAIAISQLDAAGNTTFVNADEIGFMGGAIQITPTQSDFVNAAYVPSSTYQFAIYGYYKWTYGGLYTDVVMAIVQDLPTFDPALPAGDGRRLGTCTISWVKAQANPYYSVDDDGFVTVTLPPPGIPNFSRALENVGDIYYNYLADWNTITDNSNQEFNIVNDAKSGNEPLQAKITKSNFETALATNPDLKKIGSILTQCNVNNLVNPANSADFNYIEIVLNDMFNINTLQDLVELNNFCNVFVMRFARENVEAVGQFGVYEYVMFQIIDAHQDNLYDNCPISIQGRNVIRIEGDVTRCYNQIPTPEQIPFCYATDVSLQGDFLLYGFAHNNCPIVTGSHAHKIATGVEMELSHPTKQQYYSITLNPTLINPPPQQQTNYSWIPATKDGVIELKYNNEAFRDMLPIGDQDAYTGARSQYAVFTDDGEDVSAPMLYFNPIRTPSVAVNTERIHYGTKNFKIDDEYASPSDIAEELTLQTHKLTDLRDKHGIPIPNTKELGLAVNEFIFPVYTAAYEKDGTTKIVEPGRGDDQTSHYLLDGEMPEGSFHLKGSAYNMQAYPTYEYNADGEKTKVQTGGTTQAVEADGKLPKRDYTTYFQTEFISINKPQPKNPKTDSMPQNAIQDFYMPDNIVYADITEMIPRTLLPPPPAPQALPSIGYPFNITPNKVRNMNGEETSTLVSQMCGSDNVAFLWDDTQSRMTIQFMHQPMVSIFSITPTGVSTGGENSVVLYYPMPTGYEQYPYHLNQTRDGGVNVVNWCSNKFSYPSTPTQVRKIAGIENDFTVNLGEDWFLQDNPVGPSKNYYKPGNLFWNKLGFTDKQIFDEIVGSTIDEGTGYYYPKGTTDAKIDTAFSMLTSEPPAADQPFFNSTGHWADAPGTKPGDNVAVAAGFKYSSVGALFWNNNSYGYSTPNTSGLPVEYTPSPQKPNADGKTGTPSADPQKTTFNPNLNRHTGYTVQSKESTEIKAAQLPIKTTDSYFYIMSDIMKTDFYISNNRGTPLNCVGVISKLNGSNDFYYSYGSPQSFFFDEDKTITSVTIEIRSTDLTVPPAISPYSSVIFQLVRANPQPIMPLPSIPSRQEGFTANFLQWWKAQGRAMAQKQPRNIPLLLSQMAAVGLLDMSDQSEILNDLQQQMAGGGAAPPQNPADLMDEILFRRGDVDLPEREADPAPGELVTPVPIALNPQALQSLEAGARMELPAELGVVRDRLVEDQVNQQWLAYQAAQTQLQAQIALEQFNKNAQSESGLGSSLHGSQAGPGASQQSASDLSSRRSEMASLPEEEEEKEKEEEEGLE